MQNKMELEMRFKIYNINFTPNCIYCVHTKYLALSILATKKKSEI